MRPPVVALIDSELNFYHHAFRSDAVWSPILQRIPNVTLFEPSTELDQTDAERADAPRLRAIPSRSVVAFNGTRVMGVSMIGDAATLLEGTEHGTLTSYAALNASPHAFVLVVQVQGELCDPGQSCLLSESIADAMEWVADQPWIDIVSISMGIPGNLPDHSAAHREMDRFLEASRRAHDSGKIILNSAGNYPTPTLTDYFDGPPWITSVSGFQGAPRGDDPFASRVADVVANTTQYTASRDSRDGYGWHSGTSLSTPLVAGTLAEAMWIVRSQSSGALDVPRQAWRDALNASSVMFDATDWSPTTPVTNDTVRELTSGSLPVLYAPLQMGWGFVEAAQASEIARRVIENDLSIPPEKADAAQFQAHRQALREEYWGRVAR